MKSKIILMLSLLFLWSCDSGTDIRSDEQLKLKIQTKIESKEEIINLDKITDFDWDYLVILTPYTSIENFGKNYNIDIRPISNTDIEFNDSICLLVFLKNDVIVNMVEYPRYPGDFSSNEVKKIKRKDAVFEVSTNGDKTLSGKEWITVQLK